MTSIDTIRKVNNSKYAKDNRLSFFTYDDTAKYLKSKKQSLPYVVDQLPDHVLNADCIAFDIETTGLEYPTSEIIGVGFWIPDKGMGYYFTNIDLVKQFISLSGCLKWIAHNSKFDLKFLNLVGITIPGIVFDSMILHYLWDSNDRHGLKYLANKLLGVHITTYEEATETNDPEVLAAYCISDCYHCYELHSFLYRLYFEQYKDLTLYEVELQVRDVLVRMESTGVKIDNDAAHTKNIEILQQLRDIKLSLGWNPSSNNDINAYCYGTNGIDYLKRTKTGLQATDEGTLISLKESNLGNEKLVSTIDKILEYRGLKKVSSTYLIGIPERVIKGTLYTNFNQSKARTGRLSSSDPNMQNIPGDCRNIIIARKGYSLVSLDYSQCELRILAEYSQEPLLLRSYRDGIDVHTAVTAMMLNKDPEEVTKEERRYGKTINFGVVYGMGVDKLSRMLSISQERAKELFDIYWEKLPRVKQWILSQYCKVLSLGYTETLLGRRRYFEFYKLDNQQVSIYKIQAFIDSKVKSAHDQAIFRECANHPIQGSNADLTKLAMISVPTSYDCRLLLQIHDELVFEIEDDLLDEMIPKIRLSMEQAGKDYLSVPLVVDHVIGKCWSK